MTITIENVLLVGSLLLLISVIVGKPSYKFGVPTLLIFLVIGMSAGSEGIGGIYFDDPKIAQFVEIVFLNFILFSGGLYTGYDALKLVLKEGLVLSTLGVLLTESAKIVTPTGAFLAENPKTAMKEILITANCQAAHKKIVDLKFPKNVIIAIIKRNGKYLVPNGSTVTDANNTLIVLSDIIDRLEKVDECLPKVMPLELH